MRIWVAFLISILIHTSISLIEISEKSKEKPKPKPKKSKQMKVKLQLADRVGTRVCNNYYVGIGIEHWLGIIDLVQKGGPADRAGIRAGDTLVEDIYVGHLEPGTVVEVITERNGIIIIKNIKIEKICTK